MVIARIWIYLVRDNNCLNFGAVNVKMTGKLHDMSGHDMEELSIVCLTQKDIPYSGNSLVGLHCSGQLLAPLINCAGLYFVTVLGDRWC